MRWTLLATFVAMGAVNYLCRAAFTVFAPRHAVGPFWERFLSAMPLSLLSALAIPALFAPGESGGFTPLSPWFLAGAAALLLARFSRNLIVAVGGGTLLFWVGTFLL